MHEGLLLCIQFKDVPKEGAGAPPLYKNVLFSIDKFDRPIWITDRSITLKHSMNDDMTEIFACSLVYRKFEQKFEKE